MSSQLLFKFASRYPIQIFFTILLGFAGGLFNGVGTALIAPIVLNLLDVKIDLKSGPAILKTIMSPFDGLSGEYRLVAMAAAIVGLIILKNLTNYTSALVSGSLRRSLNADMRKAGIRLLLDVDLDFYSQVKVGDLINRLSSEVGRAAGEITTWIGIVNTSLNALVFIALLLALSWQLTLASTVLLALVAGVNQYSIGRAATFGKNLSVLSKAYSIAILETLNGIRLVKATANEEKEYKRIEGLIRDREQADFQSQANSAAISPVGEVTGILGLIGIVFLGRLFFADQIDTLSAVLFSFIILLQRLLPLISNLNNARGSLANKAASVELAHDFLRRDNKPFMINGSKPYKSLQQGIHFKQISFAYPTQPDKLVLKNVDLYLPRGTTLALVGSSGAGKSTLVDLLPRFYDPVSGSILLDQTDLREFDLKTLRNVMGIVSQDTFLFNNSVRNNIAYARPNATDEDVIAAAKRANALEFIERLPNGFDTLIGDRGVLLSGGQRQRLAIARALVQDPDILILDEATSALDTVSERMVQSAIEELSRERTTLVIAHRLSTVQKADQIAVLDQGYVVEVGTHEELLRKGGYYARLYQMQFAEQPEGVPVYNEMLMRASYEVRTLLNSMIGSIRLIADDLVDTPEEEDELLEQSYSSAMSMLNAIEVFENTAKLTKK